VVELRLGEKSSCFPDNFIGLSELSEFAFKLFNTLLLTLSLNIGKNGLIDVLFMP
jgi:hypothetical protein